MATSDSFVEMRRRNCDSLVRLVSSAPGISRAQLSKESGLAKATVSSIVDSLVRMQFLQELGVHSSTGGRPGTGLAIKPDFGYVLGMCLDENEITCCLVDLDGQIRTRFRLQIRPDRKYIKSMNELLSAVDAACTELNTARDRLLAVGIGVPGPVSTGAENEVISTYRDSALFLEQLKSHLVCPVEVDSNTNMAALVEIKSGCVPGSELSLIVRVGHQVRSALIINGQVLSGAAGGAGEFGHLKSSLGDLPCHCGSEGCINTIASNEATLIRGKVAGLKVNSVQELAALSLNGNTSARTVVGETADALGEGLASCINLIAPQIVVVTGAVVAAGDQFLDRLRSSTSRRSLPLNFANCRIVASDAVLDAECYGAAIFALKNVHLKVI